MAKWKVVIEGGSGMLRDYYLDHEYSSEVEAQSEAEDIADQEYLESDVAWTVVRVVEGTPY